MLYPSHANESRDVGVRYMDVGAFVGIMLALFFGGFGIAYGGYSMHTDYPLIALLSYVFGGGCIAASIVLTFLRVEHHTGEEVESQFSPQDEPFRIEIVDSFGKHPIPVSVPKTAEEWSSWQLKKIINQKYIRENVPLDGRNYINCEFEHVTFWYDGTAPAALTDCQFDEESMKALHTHNPVLSQWMAIAQGFGALRDDVRVGVTPLPDNRKR